MNVQRLLVAGVVATSALLAHLPSASAQSGYKAYREDSDVGPGFGQYFDSKLVQPWGMATDHNPCFVYSSMACHGNGPVIPVIPQVTSDDALINANALDAARDFWVADSDSHYVTIYDDTGVALGSGGVQLAISVAGVPTGIAVNPYCAPVLVPSGSSTIYQSACNNLVASTVSVPFAVSASGKRAAAAWLTASRDGKVYAWNPNVSATTAVPVIDDFATGADYTGLAVSPNGSMIVLADFHNGRLVAYDSAYNRINFKNSAGEIGPWNLRDNTIPAGFAPSNAVFITYPGSGNPSGTHLYVTYGKQGAPYANVPEAVGPAAPTIWSTQGIRGYVSDFTLNADGTFQVRQFAVPWDRLNAPWGIVVAPTFFGPDSSTATTTELYVGNFGDGYFNVFDAATDTYIGRLGENPTEIIPPANTVPNYPIVGTPSPSPAGRIIWEPGLRGLVFKRVLYNVTPGPTTYDWALRLFFNANIFFNATVPTNEYSIFGFIRPT